MKQRLHELDQASALVFGVASTWRRILLVFLACWFSVFVADGCDQLDSASRGYMRWGDFFNELFQSFVCAPWTWLKFVFVGFDGAGILMFFVLGAALLMVLYMEMGYWHGVFLVLFTQPIHALWLTTRHSDLAGLSWLFLACYLAGLIWFYVRCLRRGRMANG
ncbi:MAG: hypothetical protein ABMA01_13775 [Chthoniobacteraceae bacterium]